MATNQDYKKELAELTTVVDNLKTHIDSLAKSLVELNDSTKKQSLSQEDLTKKKKANSEATQKLDVVEEERLKLLNKLKIANSDNIQKNEEIRVQLTKQKKTNKDLAREKLGLIGAYEKESKKLIKLRQQYKDVAIQYGTNSKQALKLRDSVVKLDAKLKSVDSSVGQNQRSVGKYQNALKGLGTQVLALGSAYLGLQGVVKVFKKIGDSVKDNSQAISDALDRMKAKFNATFDAIGRAIANMDLSSIAQDIRDAREAAEEYTLAQDELGDTMRSIEIETSKVRNAVFKLREVYTNTGAEATKRLEAVQKANKLLLDLQERRSNVANEAIQAEFNLVAGTLKLNEEEKELFSSFIEDYGKKEGIYFEFQQKNIPLLKERDRLEKEINDGIEMTILASGRSITTYSSAAKRAVDELEVLNNTQLKSYNTLKAAEEATSDAQRQRITDAIVALESQEEKTQKLINETARQESTIRAASKKTTEVTEEEEEKRTKIIVDGQLDRIEAEKITSSVVEDLSEEELNSLKEQLAEEARLRKEASEERLKNVKLTKEQIDQIEFAAIESAGKIVTDRATAAIDEDLARIESAAEAKQTILDDQLDKGIISEETYTKKSAAIDLKARQESAKANKKKAQYENTINTVVAIAKTFAELGWPAGIAGAIVMGAIGAAQAVSIASEPLPQYEKGTNGQLRIATDAIVGEKGAELIDTPQGAYLSGSTAEYRHLPAGAEVFSHDSPETQAYLNGGMTMEMYEGLVNSNNKIEKAILNKPVDKNIITSGGWKYIVKTANGSKEYIDKYMRHV